MKIKMAARAIASDCLAMRVRYLNRSLTSIYDAAFRALGITASQVNMLVAIIHHGRISPAQLGQALNIEKSTLSRNLDRMRKAGWLETETSGKTHCIQASQKGKELLLELLPLWKKAQKATVTLLGDEGSVALREIGDHARSQLTQP